MRKKIQKYLSEHLLISVLLLNLAYMAINLLLYDPVWHPDDYYIAANIYGVYLGNFNSNPIYLTALYGHLVTFLLNIYGSLPWYTILSYLCEYYDAMKSQFRQTGNHLTGTEKSSIVYASLLAGSVKTFVSLEINGSFLVRITI